MRLVKGVLYRCLHVLELLSADARWWRLSDVASALELQKGPTHRLLAEMTALGWVEQDTATERYRLSLKLSLHGQRYLRGTGLIGIVQPVLDQLASRCRELVRLTVVQGDSLNWLASSQGAPPGLMYQPTLQGRPRLHSTANGKIWLSTLPEADAIRLAEAGGLGRNVPATRAEGPRVVRDADSLRHELNLTRQRGYALAVEEAEPGVKAIAVLVRAIDGGRVLGTLSIAGPLIRLPESADPGHCQLLRQAATTLGTVWP